MGYSGIAEKDDMYACAVPGVSLDEDAKKVSYGRGATKPLMVPKLVILLLDRDDPMDGVEAAEGVVDKTTGVGSSLTLFEPLVEPAGLATEYGDIEVVLESDESSMPPS